MRENGDSVFRTRVSLNAAEYELVKQQSRALGISIAEVIRCAVRDTLPYDARSPWMRFAGFVKSDNSQSSRSVDKVLYGAER